MAITGPDVSSNNGANIDWRAVRRAGHTFCFVKATEGTGYKNPFFDTWWKQAKDAGLVRGAYHFARPAPGETGREEARFFLQAIGGYRHGDLPPVLDLEAVVGLSPLQLRSWVRNFVDEVRDRTGVDPIIYTGLWFWQPHVGGDDNFGCPLWLAAYVDSPGSYVPKAWKGQGWTFWQFTDGKAGPLPHTVSGIGTCDISRFSGTRQQFDDLRNGSTREWSKDTEPHRVLDVHSENGYQRGEDVRALQAACNRRLKARGLDRYVVPEDGEFGPRTAEGCRKATWALGALVATLKLASKGRLSIGSQRMIRYPGSRAKGQLERAAARLPKLSR